ncbi:MAG: hypothetical protein ACRDV9_14025 [Acidimicrobiia bacterium]
MSAPTSTARLWFAADVQIASFHPANPTVRLRMIAASEAAWKAAAGTRTSCPAPLSSHRQHEGSGDQQRGGRATVSIFMALFRS